MQVPTLGQTCSEHRTEKDSYLKLASVAASSGGYPCERLAMAERES